MTSRTARPGPLRASVDDRLQRQRLATAHLLVGGQHQHRAGVGDAVSQALRGEAAEDHRVGRTDAGAGEHGHHAFDRHRHVDHDPVALDHAARLQRIGEAAGARQQVGVGHGGDGAVVGFEDQRRLAAEAGLDVAVEAVVRRIQGAVLEPLEEGRLAVVEHFRERGAPAQQFAREPGPVGFVIGFGLGAQHAVGAHARDPGGLRQRGGRLVDVGFAGHRGSPRG